MVTRTAAASLAATLFALWQHSHSCHKHDTFYLDGVRVPTRIPYKENKQNDRRKRNGINVRSSIAPIDNKKK
jgi:hypothetical protein